MNTCFLVEGNRRQTQAGIVFAHLLGVSIRQCIDDLALIAGASEFDDLANQVLYLPIG